MIILWYYIIDLWILLMFKLSINLSCAVYIDVSGRTDSEVRVQLSPVLPQLVGYGETWVKPPAKHVSWNHLPNTWVETTCQTRELEPPAKHVSETTCQKTTKKLSLRIPFGSNSIGKIADIIKFHLIYNKKLKTILLCTRKNKKYIHNTTYYTTKKSASFRYFDLCFMQNIAWISDRRWPDSFFIYVPHR